MSSSCDTGLFFPQTPQTDLGRDPSQLEFVTKRLLPLLAVNVLGGPLPITNCFKPLLNPPSLQQTNRRLRSLHLYSVPVTGFVRV